MKNAILLHLHYQDLWPEFWSYLKDIKDENTHLYVTVHSTETEWYNDIKANATEVYVIENKGMDFGGFLYAYNKIKHKDYLTITKLHGKKSLFFGDVTIGEKWRKELYLPLIQKEYYSKMIHWFEHNKSIFIYGAKARFVRELQTHPHMENLMPCIDEINNILKLSKLQQYEFIAGSMFAACKLYLDAFFKNKEIEIFEIGKTGYHRNYTIAHGLERLIVSQVSKFGGKIYLE